ncbi:MULTISPECIES: hypothetical protein [unclassified Comamonas]|uniref:hypothetical protein n=1 Tax=unclassified Comamonas TaxID=2638500 RepID=UPI001FA7E9E2|nr:MULTISPECIES: hypothetical protein [unclassified Comamonas]UNV91814.1 hypothetical protein MP576_05520 [Comamonas sp. 7D-2evo1]UNV94884.1 hypothetical protein MPZ60_20820 [Comamonas sp. 7D-2]UNW01452.1 hypothetical protein MP579_05505 [Comamonas sp. 7D-2evo2]
MTSLATPLTGKERIALAYQHRVCANWIIDLACCALTGVNSFGEATDLIDHILGAYGETHPSLAPLVEALASLDRTSRYDNGDCLATLREHGFNGYAVEFHTPAELQDDTDPVFDYCVREWIYAETMEQAWAIAIDWAKQEQQRIAEEA